MPLQATYPGVYVQEIPSGVRTIMGVSTSIAAFIDCFKRGPKNQAVQIFSFGDFERIFGGLYEMSEASFAIQQFFLNGGSQAWVVRVTGQGSKAASVSIGTNVLEATAINDGTWGNSIRLGIDHDTSDPTKLFNLRVTEYRSNGTPARQELYRNLSMTAADSNFVDKVVNDPNTGSALVRVNATGNVLPATNGTLSAKHTDPLNITNASPKVNVLVNGVLAGFATLTEITTNGVSHTLQAVALYLENALRRVNPSVLLLAGATVTVVAGKLLIRAGAGDGSALLSFSAATDPGSNNVTDNRTVTELKLNTATVNLQEYILGYAGTSDGSIASTAQTAATIGADSSNLPEANAVIGSLNDKTGIYALEDADLFNILCLPITATTAEAEYDGVYAAALDYCEKRRAFFIIDTPVGITTVPGIKNWLASKTLTHKNSALYFPRVQIPNLLDGSRLRSVGASGTVAGLYARTDSSRGVWKAPAGIEASLRNVSQLEYKLTDTENGVLNPLGIGCLRNFPVHGSVCWGARTREGADTQASEYKYISVRRLALFLEESLFRGSKWVVFEPNDEKLWAQIRLNLGAFMNTLFRKGAFQGLTPRDAYLVKCDSETTTPTDINMGVVNILVGFAPLKPAEFVFINIQQLAGKIES